jgi:hypothetical protein
MKKTILYSLLFSLLFVACEKDINFAYDATDNIYLNYLNDDGLQDTLPVTYSFAFSPGLAQDTLWVPVKIAGKRVNHDRQFKIAVVPAMTDAQPNLHYEPLKELYTMPADSGTIKIPLIVKNIDPALAEKSVALTINTVATADFGDKLPVMLRRRMLIFSNRLEEPSWWKYWQGNLGGPYTRVVHQLFLISGGKDLVNPTAPNGFLEIPRTLYYVENLRNLTNDPFTWVIRNPDKGYVLTKRTDGTEDYDFYNVNSPTIKYAVKFYPQVNKHFFINEKGSQIVL